MDNLLGVSHGFFMEPTAERWREAVDAGLTEVELGLGRNLPTEEILEKAAQQMETAVRAGARVSSVHLPFAGEWDVSALDERRCGFALGNLKALIDWAGEKAVGIAVLHASYEPVRDEARAARLEKAAQSIRALGAHAGVCAGQRAEILLVETAMAVAAYRGASAVGEAHVREAARFVLPHRLREAVSLDMPPPEPEEDAEQPQENATEGEETRPDVPERAMPEEPGAQREETCEAIEREAQEQPMTLRVVERKRCDGEGKRMKAVRGLGKGRYVSSRMPKGRAVDIAVDATLRQAALSQRTRQAPGAAQDLAIQVRSDDLRVKVKERRSGVSILFVVDASGSMGAQKRMGAVKGAILSMLTDAYQKRDKVGMIAFRGDGSELLLPLTSSPTLAYRRLQALRTGGCTPMAHGLCHANRLFEMERAKTPLASQYLILVSDGKSNVPLSSGNAHEDVLRICQVLRKSRIQYRIRYGTGRAHRRDSGASAAENCASAN